MAADYVGRFAPSPTGPLHFGSLVAALGSYLDARQQRGLWKLRIDDIDENRSIAGAADNILSTLEAFGFEWDGAVLYQTSQQPLYQATLAKLAADNSIYPCACTRADIAAIGRMGTEGPIYPGTCRQGLKAGNTARSLRIKTPTQPISFTDRIKGVQHQNIGEEIGDFVVKRADGFTAYQLAVVLDDQFQGITDVVRGADLLSSTPRQIYLQQVLGLPTPIYAHLPLVIDSQGRKLSKSDADRSVSSKQPTKALLAAWSFLQPDSPVPASINKQEFWEWSILNWDINNI